MRFRASTNQLASTSARLLLLTPFPSSLPYTHRYDLGDGTYLVAPADIPFAAMRASHLVVTDASGTVLRGEGQVDAERFQAFNRLRNAGCSEEAPEGAGGAPRYPMLLFTHTTFTDRLAQHGAEIRMVSQSAFNFADDAYGRHHQPPHPSHYHHSHAHCTLPSHH